MDLIKTENNTLAAYAADLQQKLMFCETLLKSGVLPEKIKTAQEVFALIIKGQEFGIAPMQSCESFAVIYGKAQPYGATLLGLCIKHGGRFSIVEETQESTIVEATRPDREWTERSQFTNADAEKAGILTKDVWRKYPKDMRYWKCVARLARRGWGDVVGGMNCVEEMEGTESDIRTGLIPNSEPPTIYRYDLSALAETDPDKYRSTEGYLRGKGVKQLPNSLFESITRIKSLEDYRIKEEVEQKKIEYD